VLAAALGILACQSYSALAASVTLAWDPSTDPIQNYVVHYGGASGSYSATTNAGTSLTQTVQGLVEGQTYYFAVTGIGTNSLESDFSNEVSYSVPVPSNAPPTITAIPNQTLNEDGSIGPLSFTVGDAETAVGSLTVTRASSNTGLIPTGNIVLGGSGANRTVTITPIADRSGSAQVTLTVSDGEATASRSFTVTVNSVNDAPTLAAIANVSVAQDAGSQTVTLTGIGTGATNEVQNLTVTASSGNTAVVPNPSVTYSTPNSTGSLQFTPQAQGVALITVTVQDNGGTANGGVNSTQRTFTVTVTAPLNTAPTIAAIADQTINEDGVAGPLSFTVGDAESSASSLTLTRTSSNTSLIPTANVVLGGNGANRNVTLTPLADRFGTSIITLTVSDGSLTATQAFTLTVNSVNDAPTLAALGDLSLNEGDGQQTVNLTGIGTGATNESQTLTVTATSSNTGLIPTPTITYTSPNSAGTLRFTPVPLAYGTANLSVTVNDGGPTNNAVTRTFTVTVNPVNNTPTLNALADVTISEGASQQTINLTGIGSGATNESQTLTVTAISSNTGLIPTPTVLYTSPNSTGTLRFTPTPLAFGTASISVTVNDGGTTNNSITQTFAVTVVPVNDVPTLDAISDVTLDEGDGQQTINLTGIGSGATNESQTLTVTAISSNTGLIPTPTITYTSPSSTGTLRFTPVPLGFGTANISVTVNDGGTSNNVVTRTFAVTVNPVNNTPTLDALADMLVNEGAGQQTVSLTGISSGASNEIQTLTVTATSSNPSLVSTPTITYTSPNSTGTLRFTPATSAFGTATITVSVNDGAAADNVITRAFTVTVNRLPVISPIADRMIVVGDAPTPVPFTISDAETAAGSLVLSASSANQSLVRNADIVFGGTGTNRTATITPVTNQTGFVDITLSVSDGTGSASSTFELSVQRRPNAPGALRIVQALP